MKRVRDFVLGKIRRSEREATLQAIVEGRDADRELGDFEATLVGPQGQCHLHAGGLILEDGTRCAYEDIAAVHLEPALRADRRLDLVLKSGQTVRLRASPEGAELLHATLRWVGNALLRRKLAD